MPRYPHKDNVPCFLTFATFCAMNKYFLIFCLRVSNRLIVNNIFYLYTVTLRVCVVRKKYLEEKDDFNLFFKSTEAKQLAQQGIEQILPPKKVRRPLPLLLSPSFFYAVCVQWIKIIWNSQAAKKDRSLSTPPSILWPCCYTTPKYWLSELHQPTGCPGNIL